MIFVLGEWGWACEKAVKLAIFAKSSGRLRDRPWQTDLLFPPKLNEKARGTYNSCSCWVVLFTCWTTFIPFIILLVLSKFPLTWKIVDIDGFSPTGKYCDRSLENAARGRKPRAAFSRPRLTYLFISSAVNWLTKEFVYGTASLNRLTCLPQTIRKKSSQRLI